MMQQSEIHPCVVAVFGESRYAVPVERGGGSGVAGVGVDDGTQNLGGKWTTGRRDGSGLWKTWKVESAASRTAGEVRPGRSSAGNEAHREFGTVQAGQSARMEPARQQSLQSTSERQLASESVSGEVATGSLSFAGALGRTVSRLSVLGWRRERLPGHQQARKGVPSSVTPGRVSCGARPIFKVNDAGPNETGSILSRRD